MGYRYGYAPSLRCCRRIGVGAGREWNLADRGYQRESAQFGQRTRSTTMCAVVYIS